MHACSLLVTLVTSLSWVGCHRDPEPPSPSPPPPRSAAPLRGATGDAALRVMLSELASARACALIKGQFRPLRAPDRRDTVTGILWIRDCEIVSRGTRVTFHLKGSGWQWAEQTKHEAGGAFAVRQYVKFGVDVELPGSLDLAYDVDSHVASLWFSLSADPAIDFTPVGEVEVDAKGAWSSVIGAVSSLFASSPEERAARQARNQGTRQFEHELADGMAVTINLCTGLTRFNLGRPARGAMQAPDAGETRRVPIELQPGGLMVFGPQLAPDGMTIQVDAQRGAVRVALACADQAEQVAQAYLEGRVGGELGGALDGRPEGRVDDRVARRPDRRVGGRVARRPDGPLASPVGDGSLPALATADVRTSARLHVSPQRCPVVVLAQSLDDREPVTFAWQRPQGEAAHATGGPLIHCAPGKRARDKPAATPIQSAQTSGERR